MKTERLTVAQALVRFLSAQQVERDGVEDRLVHGVLGIFGHGQVAGLGVALAERPDLLRFYRVQNEQAGVHAALAFAKHRRRLGTLAVTSSIGPGATNMLTGAAAATVNRLPVLLLPSDYFATRIPDPVLQQLEHPIQHDASVNDAFRPLARFFTRISRPEQLLDALPQAMRVLADPAETGAVVVSLPEDVQAEAFDWPEAFFAPRVWRVRRPPPEPEAVTRAAGLLAGARRPLVVAGGGVRYSAAEGALRELAEAFGLPVVESQAGKGALPTDHPLNLGPLGANGNLAANRLARRADLVLAVGTRLGDFVTASKSAFQNPEVRFLGLNLVPFDAAKLGGLMLVADAREGLRALAAALKERGHRGTPAAYRRELARLKARWDEEAKKLTAPTDGPLSQAQVIAIANRVYGEDAVVVNAAGSLPGDLLKLWRTQNPLGYHLEYGYSTMGYEIAAGVGVALADPDARVLVMVGDGSYLMMNSEIVTAVAEGLSFTVLLVDNHGFQSIHGLQRSVGSPSFGNELRFRNPKTGLLDGPAVPVDFAAHAASMGAKTWRAQDAAGLEAALTEARAAEGVRVVVAEVDPEARVPNFEGWWDVPVPEVSTLPAVRRARTAYEKAKAKQRPVLPPAEEA